MFCPSCHAKRLARWTLWLDETLLAPVPHRQVVFTIPKRLRPYCLYRRTLLGDLARLAARIVTAGVRATTGEPDLNKPTARWPTGIPISISSSSMAASGPTAPSCTGPAGRPTIAPP